MDCVGDIMRLLKNEDGVSELVGAMMVLLIGVLFLGTLQAYEVPKWNKELEKQHFDTVQSDFISLKGDLEDVSIKNIPRTGSLDMGMRYPERFMLRNPGPGVYGTITTYPLNINISYSKKTGPVQWKNYTSIGMIYEVRGISEYPELVHENGLLIKDYGSNNFSLDDNQSLTAEDNIFIPVISGSAGSRSSIETETFDIRPVLQKSNNQVRFSSANITIETRYPDIWKNLPKVIPSGSNFTVENSTNCPSGVSNCIKITNVPGYYLRRLNLPDNNTDQLSAGQIRIGMVSIDNSMMSTRGATGPDGQDMWDKGQGRLDIPGSSSASQFIIQDITMSQSWNQKHEDENEDEEDGHEQAKLKFSVTDTNGHLWTVEIKLKQEIGGILKIDYVKQRYPKGITNSSLNVSYGKYNVFTNSNITLSRTIDLTPYYGGLSNISVPNVLTIDQMDPQILYVNFVIN